MTRRDRELIDQLERARNQFGRDARNTKFELLEEAAGRELRDARSLLRYHEVLLFIIAHPDDARASRLAASELERLAEAIPSLLKTKRGWKILTDSGLPGTEVGSPYSLTLIEWILGRCPGEIALDWEGLESRALSDRLGDLVLPAARDGQLRTDLSIDAWVNLLAGPEATPHDEVACLVRLVRGLECPPPTLDQVFESLDLFFLWTLNDPEASRTFARFPDRPVFYQRSSLKRRFHAKRLINKPLKAPANLPRRRAREMIDIARAVLAVRKRETDPVTFANPREVCVYNLDRGVDVALFGMTPDRRMQYESFFGFVAARNRVPIAYGGAWVMGRRAEIGVHLFDTFRGGESAYLFAQVMRVYRWHYNLARLLIDPFQFGADNPEAIRSGAFWFYHRLGFRPVDEKLRVLAREEEGRVRTERGYRTPAQTLRRFTRSALALDIENDPTCATDPPHPADLGVAVARMISEQFDGDHKRAARWARRRVVEALDSPMSTCSDEERAGFDRLCPVVALIPDLDKWPRADKQRLVALMRAKGGPRERDHVRRLQDHARYRAALCALVEA